MENGPYVARVQTPSIAHKGFGGSGAPETFVGILGQNVWELRVGHLFGVALCAKLELAPPPLQMELMDVMLEGLSSGSAASGVVAKANEAYQAEEKKLQRRVAKLV